MGKQRIRRRLEEPRSGHRPPSLRSLPNRPNRNGGAATPGGSHGLRIQRKLTLGPANDHYEREADSVARQVMRHLAAPSEATPEPSATEGGAVAQRFDALDEDELRMKGDPGLEGGGAIHSDIESSIQAARSGGSPSATQSDAPWNPPSEPTSAACGSIPVRGRTP